MIVAERLSTTVGMKTAPSRRAELEAVKRELGCKTMSELLGLMIDEFLERCGSGSRKGVNRAPVLDIESTCNLFREFLEGRLTPVTGNVENQRIVGGDSD